MARYFPFVHVPRPLIKYRWHDRNLSKEPDALAYNAEKTLREHGDRVPADIRSQVEERVAALRRALEGSDISQIRSAMRDLEQAMLRIGQALYAATGQPTGGGPSGGQPPSDGGTVEGEFREV